MTSPPKEEKDALKKARDARQKAARQPVAKTGKSKVCL